MVNEASIRTLAHQIWEAEGRPEGQSEQHWKQAVILAESQKNSNDVGLKRSTDPSEAKGNTEPAQPDQT